jgi:predicted regulator of Ras-like GTPase activity (Roadblock/LC7/MglB family)
MTVHTDYLSGGAQQFNWLLKQFATKTAEVLDAIAVSSDGLLIAMANPGNRDDADRLAAITSAMISLGQGASRVYNLGQTNKIIMDMDQGYLLVSAISAGSALGVLASRAADLGNLAYQMAVFANRAGSVLTPQLIEELKVTV